MFTETSHDKPPIGPGTRHSMYEVALALNAVAMAGFGFALPIFFSKGNIVGASICGVLVVCCAVFYWFGQKRSSSLKKQARELLDHSSEEEAAQFLAAFRQTPESTTGVTVHRTPRTFVVATSFLACLMLFLACLIWFGMRDPVWMGAGLAAFSLVAGYFLRRSDRQPVYLRIGPLGIEDPSWCGLIAWADIEGVFLGEQTDECGTITTFDIAVRNPDTYRARAGNRAWWTSRFAGGGAPFRFPFRACDVPPGHALVMARHFHELAMPSLPFFDTSKGYRSGRL